MMLSDLKITTEKDKKLNKNRLAIAFFFDGEGIVDEYFFYLLEEMRKFTVRNVFVSNGPINDEATVRLEAMGFEIVIRDNIGFDVWAYKTAIEHVGYESLGEFDEVLLFNHTFYGPIYPFEEMFETMDRTPCGFWGITAHKEMDPNPFTQEGILPRHLNSHFIAVRRDLASSCHFEDYWRNMPMITSYNDSVLTHESRFTKHFQDLGYICKVYDDDDKYSSLYPCFIEVDETLVNRCPILKRRVFFHDPIMHESNAIDLPRALRIMRDTSKYNESLIWPNIVRTADLRTLNTVAALTTVFPDVRLKEIVRHKVSRIAVCAHIYYTDMVPELLDLSRSVGCPFDFIVTTDTDAKAEEIRVACEGFEGIQKLIIRVMTVNRGRDMSALFITCRDLFLEDNYDLVCRIHSKKSPQVDSARSNIFKRHMFENLLNSRGYVDNVIDMFETQDWIGVAVPPAVHISYSTLGLGWFSNKPKATEEARKLGLKVKLDDNSPVAAFGTMFWFRPKALKKLFERRWKWEEFNAEPDHVDGGLAHAIERLITYTAQDAGYTTQQISSRNQISYNYSMLEFKYAELSTNIKESFFGQVVMARQWSAAGNPLSSGSEVKNVRNGFAFKALWHEDETLNGPFDPESSAALRPTTNAQWRHRTLGSSSEAGSAWIQKRLELFDSDFETIKDYISRAGWINLLGDCGIDVETNIREYILYGWTVGQDIFAFFDSIYYLNNNKDVAESNMNPFMHYITYGWREGRSPHPLFDIAYYRRHAKMEVEQEMDPVLHFLKFGIETKVSPHPLFDMKFYYDLYPEVAAAGENALSHYIRHGIRERRQPHILFNLTFYEAGLGGRLNIGVNPLVHYLDVGSKEGIDPHVLFDGAYYASTIQGGLRLQDALIHFLSADAETRGHPHPLFDQEWYVGQLKTGERPENPLIHYLQAGPFKEESPHPLFDGAAYLKAHPDVRTAGMDPLVHYVSYGAGEKSRRLSGFDETDYRKRSGISNKAFPNAFIHFLKYEYQNSQSH